VSSTKHAATGRNQSRISRNWSRDALRDPWWNNPGSRKRPFALGLAVNDPELGLIVHSQGSLTADALAQFTDRAERLVQQIADHDWADAEANHAEETGLECAAARRQKAERLEGALRRDLTVVLTGLLSQRVGCRLDARELHVFLQLAARLAEPDRETYVDGWQVCERCDAVFPAKQRNARRCPGCRRKQAPRVSPVRDGGVHLATHGDPPEYLGQCEECGRQFNSRDSRQRLCPDCGTNAARQKRFRARRRKPG
jgi:hypothetical protein